MVRISGNQGQMSDGRLFDPSLLPVCPRSSDLFYVVTYYIKWVTTSWTDSIKSILNNNHANNCIALVLVITLDVFCLKVYDRTSYSLIQ